ncbi:MAG: sulfatase-like hydrolase/transferase [Planctomycetales bacterium]|nr:sulfatase-like hydrolase/transferase [Planctomycetales bacterium]
MPRYFLLLLAITFAGGLQAAERPNIILIMVDDMGWSDLGCYGGEIETPYIDSLSAEGLRFTQFYNNSVCGATRASLLTGLYCQQVGHAGDRWNEPKDFSKCVLIPEVLQAEGYHTAMVGKWQGRDLAVERGFDRFFGPNCQGKIDIMATCLDIAGLPYPKNFEGRQPLALEGKSLSPIFRGQQRTAHQTLAWHCLRGRALRNGSWKLVRPDDERDWELYNLSDDVGETHNLAQQHPDRVLAMGEQYEQWRQRVGAR